MVDAYNHDIAVAHAVAGNLDAAARGLREALGVALIQWRLLCHGPLHASRAWYAHLAEPWESNWDVGVARVYRTKSTRYYGSASTAEDLKGAREFINVEFQHFAYVPSTVGLWPSLQYEGSCNNKTFSFI
jgi:hypothetical protein